jgi:hypothetical protein
MHYRVLVVALAYALSGAGQSLAQHGPNSKRVKQIGRTVVIGGAGSS